MTVHLENKILQKERIQQNIAELKTQWRLCLIIDLQFITCQKLYKKWYTFSHL